MYKENQFFAETYFSHFRYETVIQTADVIALIIEK